MIRLFNVLKCPVNVRLSTYKCIDFKVFIRKRTYRTWLNVRSKLISYILKCPLYHPYIIIYHLFINNTIGHLKVIKRT